MSSRLKWATRWLTFLVLAAPFGLMLALAIAWSRLRRAWRGALRLRPAILWGPTPIINIKYNSEAMRRRGYSSKTLAYGYFSSINHPGDFDEVLITPLQRLVLPYVVFIWALLTRDVFHFFFDGGYLGYTPLRYFEYPLLKLAGKRLIASPYGGDVIQPSRIKPRGDVDLPALFWEQYPSIDEDRIGTDVSYTCRYADFVIGVNELIDFLPRYDACLPVLSLDLDAWPLPDPPANAVPKVVHAPNHRKVKGTDFFLQACNDLQREGLELELELVERMPNDEARRRYAQADVVLDQLLLGAYGLLAVECMALGKPVICYLREDLFAPNVHWAGCPIVSATPQTVRDELRRLLQDPGLRLELGRRGREFVEHHHSLEAMGGQFESIYRRLGVVA
ncbi:MAG TPA: glycosyltransferase [Chloroflexota bacterium]